MKISCVERTAGHWQIRIDTGNRDDAGQRVFKYETITGSEDDAFKRRFAILTEHEQGTFALPDKVTLGTFFDRWLETRTALKIIRRTSSENYNKCFDAYVRPTLGNKRLQSVTGQDLQGVYIAMSGDQLSQSTIHHVHRILCAMLKAARKAKLIKTNPMEEVEAPRRPKTTPKAIDEAATVKLLQTLENNWKWPTAVLSFAAGLRRGEVLGLRWKDFDSVSGKLAIVGQVVEYADHSIEWAWLKTEAGRRVITLPQEAADLLRTLHRDAAARRLSLGLGGGLDEAPIFTPDGVSFYKPEKLTREFSQHCDAHGLPDFTFHGARHTHITDLLRKVGKTGAKAVSQRAGHSDIMTTLRIYQTVFEGDDAELGALSGGFLKGNGRQA